jgi:hypothetical protein
MTTHSYNMPAEAIPLPLSPSVETPLLDETFNSASEIESNSELPKDSKARKLTKMVCETTKRVCEAAKKVCEQKMCRDLVKLMRIIIPVAAILSIPLILSFTLFKKAYIGGVPLAGLFFWLEVCWGSLWVLYYGFPLLTILTTFMCYDRLLDKEDYPEVVRRLKFPIIFLLWTITSWATTIPIICYSNLHYCTASWVNILRKVLIATMVAVTILLVEKFLMQLVLLGNSRKFLGPRREMIDKILNILAILTYEKPNAEDSALPKHFLEPPIEKRILRRIEDVLSFYPAKMKNRSMWTVDEWSTLESKEERDLAEYITNEIWEPGKDPTQRSEDSDLDTNERVFTRKDVKRAIRQYLRRQEAPAQASLQAPDQTPLQAPYQTPAQAHNDNEDDEEEEDEDEDNNEVRPLLMEIMRVLDQDKDDKITRPEMKILIENLIIRYKKCRKGIRDIENIIQSLDGILLIIVLIIGGLVYGE